MFTVLNDQIEHLDNSSIQSYCVGKVFVTNEIIQFSEQKLVDKNSCEWSFYSITPANSMLRQCYAAVSKVTLQFLTTALFAYLYKSTNSILQP